MDLNERLKELNDFNEVTLQLCNTSGEVESVKTYTQEDFKELHEQWGYNVVFDLNIGKILSSQWINLSKEIPKLYNDLSKNSFPLIYEKE